MRYRPQRKPCDLPVLLGTPKGDEVEARATSVSSTGLRIQGVQGLRREDELRLTVGGTDLTGHVAWVNNDRAGVEFDIPQTRKALRKMGFFDDPK